MIRMGTAILSWDMLRWLAREGVTLGAHTRSHPLLNRISLGEVRAEAAGSWRDLEREIGTALPILAHLEAETGAGLPDFL
jgi:peptidoglycan/xylan/chitin deacetylase (PgdA/CDA1 family)